MGSITRKLNPFNAIKYILNKALTNSVSGVINSLSFFYRQIGFSKVKSFNSSNRPLQKRRILDLVTIAFNDENLIRYQIHLLRKNLLDSYHYTVADNSTSPSKRRLIQNLCKRESIGYISLPKNPFNTLLLPQGNLSHGTALNWIYYNYLKPRNARFVGIIDHDIFPVNPCSIIPILEKNPFYGRVISKENLWFLWPGLFFADNAVLNKGKVNFLQAKIHGVLLDTGAGNWRSFYSKMKKEAIPPLPQKLEVLCEGEIWQDRGVEFWGDWLHMINGSQWKKAEQKAILFKKFITHYL